MSDSLWPYRLYSWRRQRHPTPVLLPGKSRGQRSLVGCSPWGCKESDTTEPLHFHFSLSCIGEGNGNPLQCSYLENPRDGRAWRAAIFGVAQSWTRLKRVSSSSRNSCRLYSPWNSLGQNTEVGSLSLLQASSQPRDQIQVSHIAGGFVNSWATRKAQISNTHMKRCSAPPTIRTVIIKKRDASKNRKKLEWEIVHGVVCKADSPSGC